jgi:Tol biopolymer transport system component
MPAPPSALSRRRFLASSLAGSTAFFGACRSSRSPDPAHSDDPPPSAEPGRLFFVSQGRTLLIRADGTGLRPMSLDRPNQVTWQPAGFFPDGRRVLFLSMEARRDGPGRPFEEYYTRTPTHLWVHDLDSGSLEEVATRERMAVFYTPQLLLPDGRMLVQVVRDQIGQIYLMNLDGTGAREFTRAGEGLPYGLSLSPDSRRVAYHLASPAGYQIWTSDLEGRHRTLVAAHPDFLYFGPAWSPDGTRLAFQACRFREDPGHDWSDVCLCRPDGSEFRSLTVGQSMWFGATYGSATRRGGGSNVVAWTRDGAILFPRRHPDSKVPWEFQAQRPDTDHFNRDFKPEAAVGGTEICRLNPGNGRLERLTRSDPPVWDFRASESSDGRRIVFCRAETGGSPALWVMNADGTQPRLLTRGLEDSGADHPRWLPSATVSAP